MIWEILQEGKKNKLPARDIMRRTGIKSKRELSEIVRQERDAGKLILSTKAAGGGYYLPGNIEEAQEFIETYSREARALFSMLKMAREYVKAAAAATENG